MIVLGILGAFAVDEYREAQHDRSVADEYLEQLVEDLVQDRNQIVTSEQRMREELLAADQILTLLGAPVDRYWHEVPFYSAPSPGEIDRERIPIQALGEFESFRPYSSTYGSMVSNGDLRTITDPALRRTIVSYYEETERRQRDYAEFLRDAIRLKDLLLSHGVDVHGATDVGQVIEIDGLVPVLAAARDSSHWRLARLYLIKLHQQRLINALLGSDRLSPESHSALRAVLYLTPESQERPQDLDWDSLVAPDP